MIWIQFAVLLTMILIGARLKGIGLGVMAMIGMLLFIVFFHMAPADPPVDVMLIILSIVTTGATLQAAGGLDYLVSIAERIIRSKPSQINFIAPLTAFFLCLFAGTSHIVYSLLPIIAEVSAKKRIRPERSLSASVVASHLALTGSPMSAATAAFALILGYPGASADIMLVCIPACLMGVLAASVAASYMGKELNADPLFIEKMKDPEFAKSIDADHTIKKELKPGAKISLFIFCIAILLIILFGAFPQLIPQIHQIPPNMSVGPNAVLKMSTMIEIITLSASAAIMLITKTTPAQVTAASLFTSMAAAVVSVFGVVWMSATFMSNNQAAIQQAMGGIVQAHPWTFAFALFIMGALMFSQAATTKAMMPLGVSLGVAHPALIALFPALNSDFVLPGYPTLLAAINFDRTGSTKIGKYVLNHSFILPGIVAVTVAVITGFLIGHYIL